MSVSPLGVASAACFEELAAYMPAPVPHTTQRSAPATIWVERNRLTVSDFPMPRAAYGEHVKHGTN